MTFSSHSFNIPAYIHLVDIKIHIKLLGETRSKNPKEMNVHPELFMLNSPNHTKQHGETSAVANLIKQGETIFFQMFICKIVTALFILALSISLVK